MKIVLTCKDKTHTFEISMQQYDDLHFILAKLIDPGFYDLVNTGFYCNDGKEYKKEYTNRLSKYIKNNYNLFIDKTDICNSLFFKCYIRRINPIVCGKIYTLLDNWNYLPYLWRHEGQWEKFKEFLKYCYDNQQQISIYIKDYVFSDGKLKEHTFKRPKTFNEIQEYRNKNKKLYKTVKVIC